jgi:hypothetical protein
MQMLRVAIDDLTPWKGGGYGMFSTVDAGGARRIRVQLDCERAVTAVAPRDASLELVSNLPSDRQLQRYAESLSHVVWVEVDDPEAGRAASSARPALRPWRRGLDPIPRRVAVPRTVRVTVYRPRYDVDLAEIQYVPLKSVEVPGPALTEVEARVGGRLEMWRAHLKR